MVHDDTPSTTIDGVTTSVTANGIAPTEDASSTAEGGGAPSETAAGAVDGSADQLAELTIAYASDPFDEETFDVKQREQTTLLGTEATLTVIGSSHYVAAPELGVYELLSCASVDGDRGRTIPLDHGVSTSVCYDTEAVTIETTVEARPAAAFPGPEPFDVDYRFGPGAYTTIDCSGNGYETYHTYPELDLAVYTQSTYDQRDARAATTKRPLSERRHLQHEQRSIDSD